MANQAPLVSIALFAYNQESYIDRSIDAALSQDYPNLEIILSDDCSKDRTFDIITRRVAAYDGPHQVRARQSSFNGGTLRHVLEVARESRGEFLVLATGDDIQLPGRTRILFNAWKASGASAFSTAWDVIDDKGRLLTRHIKPEASGNLVWQYFNDPRDRRFISGPTAAYDPKFLKMLPLPRGKVFHEDTVFTLILHALGREIDYTDISTVQYRIHDQSYSNRSFDQSTLDEIISREMATAAYSRDTYAYLDYILNDFIPGRFADNAVLAERLNFGFMRAHLKRSDIAGSLMDTKFLDRLRTLATARSIAELKVIVPRLVGLRALSWVKFLINRV